jgi:hypothetical protein
MKKIENYEIVSKINDNYFIYIWHTIANKFKFKKINSEHNNINIKNKYKIIMTEGYELAKNIFDSIFVVQDNFENNRYFIGFSLKYNYTNCLIFGIILYLDNNNTNHINILFDILCNYDTKNITINSDNIFMYNQTLVFFHLNNDTYKLSLSITLLSYDDKIINYCYHNTNIKIYSLENNIQNYKRFILFNNIVFDLGSLKLFTNNYNYLQINSYNILTHKDIQNIKDNEEYYGDNYPNNCSKCNNLLYIALYNCNYYNIDLGNSFCINCLVRFSKSCNSWICCKIKQNNEYLCSTKLYNTFICNYEHSTTNTTIVKKTNNKYHKYPYKEIIIIHNEKIK